MEFTGRISRLFVTREGVSMRTGQPWKALPFIFEFFEREEDTYASFAKLETYDTNIMAKIAKFVTNGEDGKAIIKDGCMELTKNVEVKCNIKLNVRVYKENVFNEVILRSMEVLTEAETQNTQAAPAEEKKQGDSFSDLKPADPADDLPF